MTEAMDLALELGKMIERYLSVVDPKCDYVLLTSKPVEGREEKATVGLVASRADKQMLADFLRMMADKALVADVTAHDVRGKRGH